MKKKKTFLYYIYCALGQKSHPSCDKTADRVALIRLLITLQILITNFFIIGGVIVNVASIKKHWNDETKVEVYIDGVSAEMYQTPPARKVNRVLEFE
jgi:cell division protein FtsX